MNNDFQIKMFENIHGTFTVMKINRITNTVTDIAEFADKNSAIACAIDNGYKVSA